jgi:hypothetical protein
MVGDQVCCGPCNIPYQRARAIFDEAQRNYERDYEIWVTERHREGREPIRPEKPRMTPSMGTPIWCGKCTSVVRRELAELDDLAARLLAEAGELHSDTTATRISGSKGRKSPSPLADLVDELESGLRAWEEDYRGKPVSVRRGYLTSALTAEVDWLRAHFDQCITHPGYAQDFGRFVRNWHRKMKNAGHAGTVRHKMKRPCPRCDALSLVWEQGSEYVQCQRRECGRMLSYSEYKQYEDVYPHLEPAR